MSIGVQPFELPINAVKKETSLAEKIIVNSHDENGVPTFYETRVDRKIHTRSVKVKFYIVGFRNISVSEISLVARWCELEPYQLDFYYPVQGAFLQTYRIGFYPYVDEATNELVIRLQLVPHPGSTVISELYIEKLTVIDSDFDSELSWFTDPDIPPIVPPIDPPVVPPEPPYSRRMSKDSSLYPSNTASSV